MAETSYLIGLGSNRYRSGPPRQMIARAMEALTAHGVDFWRRHPTECESMFLAKEDSFCRQAQCVLTILFVCQLLQLGYGFLLTAAKELLLSPFRFLPRVGTQATRSSS